MIAALKAEVLKVLTIRSTYVIVGITLALEIFVTFYISGWQTNQVALHQSDLLASGTAQTVHALSLLTALIGLFLVTHEFRYNTAAYSLTLSNNRSKVLAAKIIVVSVVAVLLTLLIATLSPLLSLLGIQAHHLHLATQSIPYKDLLWRCLFYGWGYSMAGLVIAALVRNQIGALVTLFIVPGTIEGLLMLWLKHHVVYLPFSALNIIIGHGQGIYPNAITPFHAALVFSGWLVGGLVVAWVLFLRRDAA
jgi:ABC-2 type transport system permease protein